MTTVLVKGNHSCSVLERCGHKAREEWRELKEAGAALGTADDVADLMNEVYHFQRRCIIFIDMGPQSGKHREGLRRLVRLVSILQDILVLCFLWGKCW